MPMNAWTLGVAVAGVECLHQLGALALRRLVPLITTPATTEKHRSNLELFGPSYVLTTVLSIALAGAGCTSTALLIDAPDAVKMSAAVCMDTEFKDACEIVENSNVLFAAYLIQDLVRIVGFYPRMGGLDMILHHVGFATCAVLAGHLRIFPFPYSVFILMELSTVLLELRWFLIQTGRGHLPLMQTVNVAFGVTFIILRIGGFALGLYDFVRALPALPEGAAPTWVVSLILVLSHCGFLVQLVWLRSILKMAGGSGKPRHVEAPAKTVDPAEADSSNPPTAGHPKSD